TPERESEATRPEGRADLWTKAALATSAARGRAPRCPTARPLSWLCRPDSAVGPWDQYQEELPVARVVVRQFDIHVGRCARCGRCVRAGIRCKPPTPSVPPPRSSA